MLNGTAIPLHVAYGDVVERGGRGFLPSQSTRFSSIASTSNPVLGNKGVQRALDDLCDIARLVVPGPCYFLYLGWVHPYLAGLGRRYRFDSGHPRPEDRLLNALGR